MPGTIVPGFLVYNDMVPDIYERVLDLDPNDLVALNNLAWYLRERDPKKALAYAEKAHELAPKAPSILDTYAMALLANGDNAKALRMIERALDKAPKNPSMRLHYARIAAANGDRAGAMQTLKVSMANNFDPLSANKIDPLGATKISARVCASVDSSLLPA